MRQTGHASGDADSKGAGSSHNHVPSHELNGKGTARGVRACQEETSSSSNDSDGEGLSDIDFGSRSQPLRYSKATRYHMLLEVALERSRRRKERGSERAADGTLKSTKLIKNTTRKASEASSSCAQLYADPFATTSEESDDGEWDPAVVYGEAARRRLKSCYSETESESEESADEQEACDGGEELGRKKDDSKQKNGQESRDRLSERRRSTAGERQEGRAVPPLVDEQQPRSFEPRSQLDHTELEVSNGDAHKNADCTDDISASERESSSADVSARASRKTGGMPKDAASSRTSKDTKLREKRRLSPKRARIERARD